jgi:hypothetical protein
MTVVVMFDVYAAPRACHHVTLRAATNNGIATPSLWTAAAGRWRWWEAGSRSTAIDRRRYARTAE